MKTSKNTQVLTFCLLFCQQRSSKRSTFGGMNKKQKRVGGQPKFERPIDRIFYEMDQEFASGNKSFYALTIGLVFFGVLGLIWMIPFPKLGFLVKANMDTFLNWGSFYIAIIIYLYLRLAPTLSYAILFTIGLMSFCIVKLEYLERDGGPAVWLVSLCLLIVGLVGTVIQAKKESADTPPASIWRLLTMGPIWLWSKLFTKLNIKY